MKRLSVDLERRVLGDVPFDDAKNVRGDRFRRVPVVSNHSCSTPTGVPVIYVEFDVVGYSGDGEVRGAYQARTNRPHQGEHE